MKERYVIVGATIFTVCWTVIIDRIEGHAPDPETHAPTAQEFGGGPLNEPVAVVTTRGEIDLNAEPGAYGITGFDAALG